LALANWPQGIDIRVMVYHSQQVLLLRSEQEKHLDEILKRNEKKDEIFNKNFSYLGNKNNPPDLIIKNSEAVEVKKLSSIDTTDIQLNSSYPKSKLQSDSSLITKDCRNCEPGWKEKDMIYAVGIVESNNLKQLTMIYGDCYAADAEVYERVKKRVTKGLYDTNLEFSETKELGRINRIDPLGITKLRIRGMWLITNPFKLYADMFNVNKLKNFTLLSVMSEEKYNSFPEKDKKVLEDDKEILIKNVKINNPNNPAKLLNAKLIEYTC